MNKVYFPKEEVKSFLELKIMDDVATEEELELYEEFIWTGKLEKNSTYKATLRQMKKLWEQRY